MPDDWTKELTPSMVPEGMYRKIAEKIGTENLLKLAALIGGSTFYLPKQKQLLKPLRDKKIREEYSGYNSLQLSQKYDVSERWVQLVASQKEDDEDDKNE